MANIASITSAPSYRKRFAPSSQADWTTLRYARQRSDRAFVELEQSRPVEGWGKSALQGLCAVFSLVVVCAFLWRL